MTTAMTVRVGVAMVAWGQATGQAQAQQLVAWQQRRRQQWRLPGRPSLLRLWWRQYWLGACHSVLKKRLGKM